MKTSTVHFDPSKQTLPTPVSPDPAINVPLPTAARTVTSDEFIMKTLIGIKRDGIAATEVKEAKKPKVSVDSLS